MNHWIQVGRIEDIPRLGARVVRSERGDIAVFRTAGDEIFALYDSCPHRGGPLSQGIVHGKAVACPLHNWTIDLVTGDVKGPDNGCTRTVAVDVTDGVIGIDLEIGIKKATGTDG